MLQGLFSFLVLIRGHEGTVEDIAFDSHYRRIASVGAGHPQVWRLAKSGKSCVGAEMDLEFIPAADEWETLVPSPIPAKAYVARNVDFCDDGASILVYYCESHDMYVV
jgi:hypothetical protein